MKELKKQAHSGDCCSAIEEPLTFATNANTERSHWHAGAQAIGSLDNLGMAASTICLIHCLLMPIVITLLPVLGWQCLESKNAHHILAVFVFCFALFAIVPGYMQHKRASILFSMLGGLGLVLVATFVCGNVVPDRFELPMITAGNLILVATHWQNRKLSACNHVH